MPKCLPSDLEFFSRLGHLLSPGNGHQPGVGGQILGGRLADDLPEAGLDRFGRSEIKLIIVLGHF
jgi:hypothetical protein